MTDRFTTKGFADYIIEQRGHANTFLDRIDALIDWKRIDRVLGKHYRKTAGADGRPAYPALPMFKLLLLQRWYGLSDPGLEEAVKDRISFIRFSGFSMSGTLPDHSTICRFRNALLEHNLFERLFEEINRQLEERGILTEANLSPDAPVLADKGYSSMKNRTTLKERSYIDGIMHKAARGKPLTFVQRLMNRLISSVRYRVEQGIGTLKRGYGFSRMRYTGLTKGNMEFVLTAITFNLKKAALMVRA
ncbi:IS5/IS1182 family transposase [Syntrophorhabdus aromaticivorans]|uniref:IS5/IS1182 family transposase n=1 Tax=Syntrophorhabdus aromaticivorans TaxID=328301 RepID=UPI00041A2AED|nr:IS5/IS1182 family transposase [Syntrophorhabdus aromaticivorans]